MISHRYSSSPMYAHRNQPAPSKVSSLTCPTPALKCLVISLQPPVSSLQPTDSSLQPPSFGGNGEVGYSPASTVSPVIAIMLPTFLAQFAAGCFLTTAVSSIRQSGWKYLRLMAMVSLCFAVFAGLLLIRDPVIIGGAYRRAIGYGLGIGSVVGVVWLFVNAGQGERVRDSQRIFPVIAGLACLVAAVALVLRPDNLFRFASPSRIGIPEIALAVTTMLGAALLGSVTCGMLLGHRYLTDTEMPIAPLRRLAKIYLAVVLFRFVWLAIASLPLWSASFRPQGDTTWFWLMIAVRGGVGVVGVGIFAWMVWDCVRRRATQSATALFYLSMVFVFLGELSGQYLSRTESLAL